MPAMMMAVKTARKVTITRYEVCARGAVYASIMLVISIAERVAGSAIHGGSVVDGSVIFVMLE